MVMTSDEKIMLEKILLSEKKLGEINFKRLKNALVYIKNNLTDSDDSMDLTNDTLIDIKNIITGLNNITLRKVNVRPYEYNKMYIDIDLIEDKIYQLVDQFSERKINHRGFYSEIIDNIMMGMKGHYYSGHIIC